MFCFKSSNSLTLLASPPPRSMFAALKFFFLYSSVQVLIFSGSLVLQLGAGAKELLQSISEKQGKKMGTVESAKDIPKFLDFFKAR